MTSSSPASSPTLAGLAADLAAGRTSAVALTQDCLSRIADPDGEGKRAFISVDHDRALAAAAAQDALRAAGAAPSPFAGIPIAIKDMFDVAGEVTAAGSVALADTAPATRDAPTVARLRRAGFVFVGRNNMTEFAYSGLGLNVHYGDPRAPFERDIGRVSGGSTSGGAVAVADGMAHAALGSDTGGSLRIPAAFCGIVGFKPTARRVPLDGAYPLAPSLDSMGAMARSVACCAALDAILSGSDPAPLAPRAVEGLRLLIPTTIALDGLDAHVAAAFEAAVTRLSQAGARITSAPVPEFAQVPVINARGGITACESHFVHRALMAEKGDLYDPRVKVRIERALNLLAADYLDCLAMRREMIAGLDARLAPYDALLLPTTPIIPPRIADLQTDADFARDNLLVLRNPTLINMMDGCAISLPLAAPSGAPAGLMLAAPALSDARLLSIAAGVEAALR